MTSLLYSGGTTVYLRQTGGVTSYSVDQTTWLSATFPITLTNTNTAAGLVIVLFITDVTLTTSSDYFVCASSHIQFGSPSLNSGGSRPTITVDSVLAFSGLIENSGGNSNINVYNLHVHAINGSALNTAGGWIGQRYFGGSDNYVINCSSDGDIIDGGGGIVGQDASNVHIIGCWSLGQIGGTYAGGIVGLYAGTVTIDGCWSEGLISGIQAGGILGAYASTSTRVSGCYSIGDITGLQAGGIVGSNASGLVVASYSSGNIVGTNSGGIVGSNSSFVAVVNNSYSVGAIGPTSGGIYGGSGLSPSAWGCYVCGALLGANGQIFAGSTTIPANCAYSAGGWSSSTANATLFNVGTAWIEIVANQPYELNNMGYTPYTNAIITTSTQTLVHSSASTVLKGSSTNGAIVSGQSYTIVTGGGVGVGINATSGVISTTSSTPSATYTLLLRNTVSGTTNGYSLSTYTLTVTTPPTPTPPPPPIIVLPPSLRNGWRQFTFRVYEGDF